MTSELVNAELTNALELTNARAHERIASYCHIKYD